ncbi:PRC-barrel domain-containing protein [Methanolobus halotolerans]|uniref:Photosystem reaction center subunit H n=1 Tax=Methanolobus halotolerans TaxID=2052935 RepID=A0A4E0PYD4_9EURY|nr:PRC-barrel domain-containing protein [Methanolobus halotolerans]TGC08526.1 photosystem reaction center subunit H [Methanolobus halotolerans]
MAVPQVLSTSSVEGDSVINPQGEDLGKIEDIMLDLDEGMIAYAVLSFGGFLGIGDKLFAVPWKALSKKPDAHSFILNVDKDTLENAPGFDKANWPGTGTEAHREYVSRISEYYGYRPYWIQTP